jgi:hypothetical protein
MPLITPAEALIQEVLRKLDSHKFPSQTISAKHARQLSNSGQEAKQWNATIFAEVLSSTRRGDTYATFYVANPTHPLHVLRDGAEFTDRISDYLQFLRGLGYTLYWANGHFIINWGDSERDFIV